jgi:peptidoglycan/LPS O-acetylase OafA/YrhL
MVVGRRHRSGAQVDRAPGRRDYDSGWDGSVQVQAATAREADAAVTGRPGATATATPTDRGRPGHRWISGLDGLRALAVIAVILFHLNPDYLSGGFLGVDLFFVISGYLITRLLLAERSRTAHIRLGEFYLRRARRLLPALAVLLASVGTVGWALWPDARPTLPDSMLSSIGYVTNWWLIFDNQSYFVASGRPPMLQHLWSLAIEEQYYLLWAPVVIIATAAWVGRTRRLGRVRPAVRVAVIAAGLALASTAAMAVIAIVTNVPYQADSSRVYFGTDTHAMGLLAGSAVGALAVIPWRELRRRPPRWVRSAWRRRWSTTPLIPAWIIGDSRHRPLSVWITDALGALALAGVVWFMLRIDEYTPWLYTGGFLLFAALTVLVVCCGARAGGRLGRLLDVGPLRWIGVRSYGIYLWHWPIFVVTRPLIDVQGPAWLIDIARSLLAVALAAVSYRYVETPVRHGTFSLRRLWSRRPAGAGATAALPVKAADAAGATAALPVKAADAAGATAPGAAPSRPVRKRASRHWALPAVATACVAVLVTAHVTTLQEPAWAASMSTTALPIPGVAPDLPGGIRGSTQASPTGHAAAAGSGDDAVSAPEPGADPAGESGPGAFAGSGGDAATGEGPSARNASRAAPDSWLDRVAGGRAGRAADSAGQTGTEAPTTAGQSSGKTSYRVATPPATLPTDRATTPSAPPVRTKTPGTPTVSRSATVASARISAFGDSVLLGAAPAVRIVVGSMNLDAVVGRQAWDTLDDVTEAHKAGTLAPVVLIHTGNNGAISGQQLADTLVTLKDRTRVILLNDHVDRSWQGPNNKVFAAVNGHYSNLVVIDWNAIASKNPGWFGPDGIHVNGAGAKAYAALVAKALS